MCTCGSARTPKPSMITITFSRCKPDLHEAVAHRAEANLALDRLEDVKAAYMDLFNHAPALADQLMLAMHKWMGEHRNDARGMRPADLAAFDKWLQERDIVAQQSASLPH